MLTQKLKEKSVPLSKGSSCETLFRISLKNQLRSIAIADQKAKVIIGINTILMSLFMALIGLVSNITQLDFIKNLNLSLPITIMIISCFVSGSLAIFVVRPDKKMWNKGNDSHILFRDFKNLPLGRYLDDLKGVMVSRLNIYECLIIDLYYYGRCVQRKNHLLRYAYNVFFYGLLIAVISFFILQLIGPKSLGPMPPH